MTYALDTNVVIEFLRENKKIRKHRDKVLSQGDDLIIPVVTDYEMWRGFYYRPSPRKEKDYLFFCEDFQICRMTDEIWKRSARIYADLRSKGQTVDDFDILIAAMCVENGYTLVTHNNKHFDAIDDLLKVDWQDS
jgi:predicted nucleic acid-binding protein